MVNARTRLELLLIGAAATLHGCQDVSVPVGGGSSTTDEGSTGSTSSATSLSGTVTSLSGTVTSDPTVGATESSTDEGWTSTSTDGGSMSTSSTDGGSMSTSSTDEGWTSTSTDGDSMSTSSTDGGWTSTSTDGGWTSTSTDGGWTSTSTDGGWTSTSTDAGWTSTSTDGSSTTTGGIVDCGDGQVLGAEACDDGNASDGDGCSAACEVEPGYACEGEPSACEVTVVLDAMAIRGFGCLRTTLGELMCFSPSNTYGEAGNGTFEPTPLPAFTTDDVLSVTAGVVFACAVRAGDTAWCWGNNQRRQLGPQSVWGVSEPLPVEVQGVPQVSAIEAGWYHTCAIDLVGQVWCWGGNDAHQLGRGGFDTTDHAEPVAIGMPGGLAAVNLSAGDHHTCATLVDGTVACWGYDAYGQLGDGAPGADGTTPALVPGLAMVAEVDSGQEFTCARTTTGDVYCWGRNHQGQLGIGSWQNHAATPQLVPLPGPADIVAAGDGWSACALLADDQLYCWGAGTNYVLGNGNVTGSRSPIPVMNLPALDYVDLELNRAGCLLSAAGDRYCWGWDQGTIPGYDQHEPVTIPFSSPPTRLVLSSAAQGSYYGVVCGMMPDDTVECAGSARTFLDGPGGAQGLLAPTTYPVSTPIPVSVVADVQDFAIGGTFACAATSTEVSCWGRNTNHQLGHLDPELTLLTPTGVPNLVGPVDEIDAGSHFACARTAGTVQCWGDRSWLQTGVDDNGWDVPNVLLNLDDAVQVGLGVHHGCALTATGVVRCWGRDTHSQLGDNNPFTYASSLPLDVTGLPPAPVTEIAVGSGHTCALAADEVYCWGYGARGVLGQGNTTNSDTALLVPGLPGIVRIAAGLERSCALDEGGTLYCWGHGPHGELGNGGPLESHVPIPFEAASGITDVELGNSSTCIETAAGWGCVGEYGMGQLGSGVSRIEPFPVPSAFGP